MENKLSVESQIYFLNQIKQLKKGSDGLNKYIVSKEKEIEGLDRSIEHFEFLKQFDELEKDSDESRIQIYTKKIIGLISRQVLIEPEEAEEEFKKSNTYERLKDVKTGLWSKGVVAIFLEYLEERRRHLLETVRQSKEFLELANENTEKSLTLLKEENIDIMGENTRSKK